MVVLRALGLTRYMLGLNGMLGTSDFQERDPHRKLTVGLSHAWVGGFGVVIGLPIGKEVVLI